MKNLTSNTLIELLLLIILAAIAGFLIYTETTVFESGTSQEPIKNVAVAPRNTVDLSPSTPEENEQAETVKQNDGETAQKTTPNSDVITLTRASLDGSTLEIGAMISASSYSGTCSFTVSDGAIEKQSSSKTLLGNGSSGCFIELDIDTLDNAADWDISVYATDDEGNQTNTDVGQVLEADR
ncbi:MAG: hypothetical protein AAF413_00300 [Patescibacteria group bacterium]